MRHAAIGMMGALTLTATAIAAIADGLDVHAGKALFERRWIASPSSTSSANGLGPLFNATSCDGCHKGGGPASFVADGGSLAARGFVVRLVAPDGLPDPLYGRQLQERGIPGMVPEARIFPTLVKEQGDGDKALSRMIAVVRFNGPVPTSLSEIRVAPSLAGRGLIAKADDRAVLALADPDDRDGDGISGRPRHIASLDGRDMLGRFGWKAASPSLAVSIATAAAVDMGLGSRLEPHPHGDCTTRQTACLDRLTGIEAGSDSELDDEALTLLSVFVTSLAPPAGHGPPPAAFTTTQCGSCHTPELATRDGGTVPLFSDLLLHDMGANLSGPAPDGDAAASEWKTAPLMDLAPRGGKRRYLHDGRAATVGEAIAWHGGEASAARKRFEALTPEEQAALIRYLESL
ncbi:MAG TPA: di-heme oxidoredictase family protein [Aestuariivirgaceae bacterium]|nr:di-heme oxidoredictase family protein [Aestuariivirgaceae bacterium]